MLPGALLVTAAEQMRLDVHEHNHQCAEHERLGTFALAVAELLDHAARLVDEAKPHADIEAWFAHELTVARAYLGLGQLVTTNPPVGGQASPDLSPTGPVVPSAPSATGFKNTPGLEPGASGRVHGAEGAAQKVCGVDGGRCPRENCCGFRPC